MKVKFQAILEVGAALKAVENDGYALRYVKDKDLFIKVAEVLDIDIEF